MRFRQHATSFWYYFVPFVRFWGVFTSIVLCGVGVDLATHKHSLGYFYIIFALVIFFYEITWAVSLFIQVCIRNELSSCLSCWNKVLWFNHWKKSLSYACLAIFLFAKHRTLWFTVVSGLQLLSLSGLHLVMGVRRSRQRKMHPAPRLLHSHSPSQEDNDKYDEMAEMMDDTFPAPLIGGSLAELDNGNILEM